MMTEFQRYFMDRWEKYFPQSELPICYYYTNHLPEDDIPDKSPGVRCLIGNLEAVREGNTFIYHRESGGCSGGKRYTGFNHKIRPDFEYFLSCGITDQVEGERYKKSPELVREHLKNHPPFEAPGKYLVFKRWDKIRQDEQPVAVIFYATPDVLAGLFTLANFDRPDSLGVITPMGAGCASIINYPMEESRLENPRCILGMFDVSARPHTPRNTLSFAIPIKRFEQMVHQMDESFLITDSWNRIKKRLL